MTTPLRIAINGFGRIGRHVIRAWYERGCPAAVEFIAINDLADPATLVHLLRYDSTHGRFPGEVGLLDSTLRLGQAGVRLLNQSIPEQLPWAELQIDVVLECTGQFRSRAQASAHLLAGAQRVVIGAAPFDTVDSLLVYGFNHHALRPEHRILSSVSCTTHALLPLLCLLDDHLDLDSVLFTEIHAVTSDQPSLDHVHRDVRRARSSGQNIIPTTTSALAAIRQLLPGLADCIDGHSIRVPTATVACVLVDFRGRKSMTAEEINTIFLQASRGAWRDILGWTDEPLVSSDFVHQAWSCVFDATQTRQAGQLSQILAWYDNEWGYANRLLDLCLAMAKAPVPEDADKVSRRVLNEEPGVETYRM